MAVTEKRRKEQASAAGKASGEKRSRENHLRDQNIVLAYVYLSGGRQSSQKNRKALDFLVGHGAALNDEVDNPCKLLADCTGLTPRRIQQILEKNGSYLNLSNKVDREEINVLATVAARLKEARELNGFTRQQAAAELGISLSELRQYEDGFDIDCIPLSIIKKTAELYNISVNFLFGIVDEHEDGDTEAIEHHNFMAAYERICFEDREFIGKMIQKAIPVQETWKLVTAILNIEAAASRFWKLNPGADTNMRGGGNILNRINEALSIAEGATVRLVKAEFLPMESLKHFKKTKTGHN
jgi:transcriptional regulator with XRE-family HTH domain